MGRYELSSEDIDNLHREGNYAEPTFTEYDVGLYKRYYRKKVPFGGYEEWNPKPAGMGSINGVKNLISKENISKGAYFSRIGGLSRKGFVTADEIGRILSENGIRYVDSFIGYDVVESLMICRKYNLKPYFYVPDCPSYLPGYVGVRLPFTNDEIEEYRPLFRKEMKLFYDWIERVGRIYDFDFGQDDEQIWILYTGIDMMPVNLFEDAMARNSTAVADEFRAEHGFDLPLKTDGAGDSRRKAEKIKLWQWMRRRFEMVTRLRASIFREYFKTGLLVSNTHFSTQLDYPMHGETFDIVGTNARPMMLDNDIGRIYETGYAVRIVSDLCLKPVMLAPRANLFAVGASNFVAGREMIKHMYSQGVQNGAGAFYIFFQDYSAKRDEYENDFSEIRKSILGLNPSRDSEYCGPGFSNPDKSTRPEGRWNDILEISEKLGRTKRFIPPAAETGILVCDSSCAFGQEGWERIFSLYVELQKAGVWHNFVSTGQVLTDKVRLERFKLIFIPNLDFTSHEFVRRLYEFIEQGGVAVTTAPEALKYDINGERNEKWRAMMFGIESMSVRESNTASVIMQNCDKKIEISSSSISYSLSTSGTSEVRVAGKYIDGAGAVLSKKIGRGESIIFGAPLSDIYQVQARENRTPEYFGRYNFYKNMERKLGIEDRSWVWDINTDNLEAVTGKMENNVTPSSRSDIDIEFRDFLLQHKI